MLRATQLLQKLLLEMKITPADIKHGCAMSLDIDTYSRGILRFRLIPTTLLIVIVDHSFIDGILARRHELFNILVVVHAPPKSLASNPAVKQTT